MGCGKVRSARTDAVPQRSGNRMLKRDVPTNVHKKRTQEISQVVCIFFFQYFFFFFFVLSKIVYRLLGRPKCIAADTLFSRTAEKHLFLRVTLHADASSLQLLEPLVLLLLASAEEVENPSETLATDAKVLPALGLVFHRKRAAQVQHAHRSLRVRLVVVQRRAVQREPPGLVQPEQVVALLLHHAAVVRQAVRRHVGRLVAGHTHLGPDEAQRLLGGRVLLLLVRTRLCLLRQQVQGHDAQVADVQILLHLTVLQHHVEREVLVVGVHLLDRASVPPVVALLHVHHAPLVHQRLRTLVHEEVELVHARAADLLHGGLQLRLRADEVGAHLDQVARLEARTQARAAVDLEDHDLAGGGVVRDAEFLLRVLEADLHVALRRLLLRLRLHGRLGGRLLLRLARLQELAGLLEIESVRLQNSSNLRHRPVRELVHQLHEDLLLVGLRNLLPLNGGCRRRVLVHPKIVRVDVLLHGARVERHVVRAVVPHHGDRALHPLVRVLVLQLHLRPHLVHAPVHLLRLRLLARLLRLDVDEGSRGGEAQRLRRARQVHRKPGGDVGALAASLADLEVRKARHAQKLHQVGLPRLQRLVLQHLEHEVVRRLLLRLVVVTDEQEADLVRRLLLLGRLLVLLLRVHDHHRRLRLQLRHRLRHAQLRARGHVGCLALALAQLKALQAVAAQQLRDLGGSLAQRGVRRKLHHDVLAELRLRRPVVADENKLHLFGHCRFSVVKEEACNEVQIL
eukprot:Rhum_TRINITY_DN8890_c0_g1::Rhum_TRINITY_DN8890_c0_g1_i1::g.30381::m.30381